MSILIKGKTFWLLLVIIGLISSCRKDAQTSWDTELLIPIASTSLNLQNLAKDSSLKTNPDNSLTLAYRTSLYHFNLADKLISIPDTAIGKKFGLDSLVLAQQKFQYRTTLGALAIKLENDPNPNNQIIGQIIIGSNGSNSPVPAVSGLISEKFHFDAVNVFDSATLLTGNLAAIIINHLPFPLSDMVIEVRNSGDSSLIAIKNVPPIPAYDSFFFLIDLAGKHITSQLDFYVKNLSTPGTNGNSVFIDTSDFLQIRTAIADLHTTEAWAKFPTQNVVDQTEEVSQNIRDRKLTYVSVRRGSLHVFITSSVEEELFLQYSLLGAYDNYGNPLIEKTKVPPAPAGKTVTIDSIIDISGFSINLTGVNGSKFNTYSQRVLARIDSSGITRHITLNDGITVKYEITEVAPNYVKGYLGRDTVIAADSAAFTFLNIFKSGSIDLESVNMTFDVENGLGVDGQVKLNSLVASSPVNGSRTFIGTPTYTINRASDFPLRASSNKFTIGSNIKDLLGILPNQLKYNVEVKTNLNGNTQQYRDFAYLESGLNISLDAEIPLSLIANHLLLKDTIGFDISKSNTNVNGITDGIINVITENKYPIEPVLTMIVYDSAWAAVDTLLLNTRIQAAPTDAACKVQTPARSKIPVSISEARMTNLKRGRNAIIVADFSTSTSNASCNGQHLKIYSDYNIGITFTAKFNYKVNAKF